MSAMTHGLENENVRSLVNVAQRSGLTSTEAVKQGELIAQLMAAEARSLIEARAVMALRNRRSILQVSTDLQMDLKRRLFCERARWDLPFYKDKDGKPASGWSVRFADAAMSHLGNIDVATVCVFEDETQRILRNRVLDLEKNLSVEVPIVIQKTIERRELRRGQIAISSRPNSTGQTVFLVGADEQALLAKQNSGIAKARRNAILSFLPDDVKEECLIQWLSTFAEADAKDPQGELKKLVSAFVSINVAPNDLSKFLGHPVEQLTASERMQLRGIYAAVRDGEMSWHEVLASRGIMGSETDMASGATATERLKAKVQAKAKTSDDPPAAADPTATNGSAPTATRGGMAELVELRGELGRRLGDEAASEAWKQAGCLVQGKPSAEAIAGALENARYLLAEVKAAP